MDSAYAMYLYFYTGGSMKKFLILLFLVVLGAPVMAANEAEQYAKSLVKLSDGELSELSAAARRVKDYGYGWVSPEEESEIDTFWADYSFDLYTPGKKASVADKLPANFGRPEVGGYGTAAERRATNYIESFNLISRLSGYCDTEIARREEVARAKEASPDAASASLSSEVALMRAAPAISAPATPANALESTAASVKEVERLARIQEEQRKRDEEVAALVKEATMAQARMAANAKVTEKSLAQQKLIINAWRQHTVNQKAQKASIAKQRVNRKRALTQSVFNRLAKYAEDQKAKHATVQETEQFSTKRQFRNAFRGWQQLAAQKKKQETSIKAQKAKRDRAALVSAFEALESMIAEKKDLDSKATQMSVARNTAVKRKVFVAWHQNALNKKKIKLFVGRKDLQRSAALKHKAFQVLATNRESQKAKHAVAEKFSTNRQLFNSISSWAKFASEKIGDRVSVAAAISDKRNAAALTSTFKEWRRAVDTQKKLKSIGANISANRNKALKKEAICTLAANARKRKRVRTILQRLVAAVDRHALVNGFSQWEKFNEHEKEAMLRRTRPGLRELARRAYAGEQSPSSEIKSVSSGDFQLPTFSGELPLLVTGASAEEYIQATNALAGFDVVENAEPIGGIEAAAVSRDSVAETSVAVEGAVDNARQRNEALSKLMRLSVVADQNKLIDGFGRWRNFAAVKSTQLAEQAAAQKAMKRGDEDTKIVPIPLAVPVAEPVAEVVVPIPATSPVLSMLEAHISPVATPKAQSSATRSAQIKPLMPQGPKRKKRDEAVVVAKFQLPTIPEETTLSGCSSLSSRSESPTAITASVLTIDEPQGFGVLQPVTEHVVCDRTPTPPAKQRVTSPNVVAADPAVIAQLTEQPEVVSSATLSLDSKQPKDYSSWLLGGGAVFTVAGVALLSGQRKAQGRLGLVVDALRSDSGLTFGEKVRALAGALALGAGVTLGSVGAYQKIAR